MTNIRFSKAHIIYWSVITIVTYFAFTHPQYKPEESFGRQLFYFIGLIPDYGIKIVEFYIYYMVLVPKYLINKFSPYKYVLISLLIMPVGILFRILIWNRMLFLEGEIPYDIIRNQFFGLIQNATSPPTLSIFVTLIELWIFSSLRKNKLKKLNIDSRMNFLKSQINPHFIFNTLNNIYSLSLKSKEKTAIALKKLQSTFNYLKKVENSTTVSVKSTEEYISSYIELNKMRLTQPEKVIYEFKAQNLERRIYPMLLMPFIENAFKHSNPVNENDFISIHLFCNEKEVQIEVKNSLPQHVMSKDKHSGIGLKNVQGRLDLLFHKEEYHISTTVSGNEFVSKLDMPYAKF